MDEGNKDQSNSVDVHRPFKSEKTLREEREKALQEYKNRKFKDFKEGKISLDQLDQDMSKLVRVLVRLAHRYRQRAYEDALTGVGNKRCFNEAFESITKNVNKGSRPFGLLAIDIDKFKQFNDTYGHVEGDEALSTIATLISMNTRIDREEEDLVTRYGGEEFFIILSNIDSEEELKTVAERIRTGVESNRLTVKNNGEEIAVPMTISIGGGIYRGDEDNMDF
jgi:diguanylate cyclase (GGDEF)-like protein